MQCDSNPMEVLQQAELCVLVYIFGTLCDLFLIFHKTCHNILSKGVHVLIVGYCHGNNKNETPSMTNP